MGVRFDAQDWLRPCETGQLLTIARAHHRCEALVLSLGAAYIIAFAIAQRLADRTSVTRVLDNTRWTLDALLGLILVWLGWRAADALELAPRRWFLVGWAAYAIGQILWDIQAAMGTLPFPGPSDPFYMSLPLLVSFGFITVLFTGLSRGQTRAAACDAASVLVMALTLTLAMYLPLWKSTSVKVNLTAIAYPVLYLTAFGLTVLTILIRTIPIGLASATIMVALGAWAYCWLEWNLRVLRGEEMDGLLVGYAFSLCMLPAAAALGRWRPESSVNAAYIQWARRVQRLFPLVLVLAACAAFVVGRRNFDNSVAIVIDIGAAAMILLAAARQSLVLFEQDQVLEAERRLRQSERREEEARREVDRIKHDLNTARTIQRGLLPSARPDIAGYDIAGWSQPADETGGDYYDWQQLGGGRIVVSLADATGHGIGPALVTSVCRAYSRASMDQEIDLIESLVRINRLLAEDLPAGRFVTFVAARLDAREHRLSILSAGHGPIFWYAAGDTQVRTIDTQGMPLGVAPDAGFQPAESIALSPGDFVASFTDGFFEWANDRGEQFGTERLGRALVRHAHLPAAAIIERVRAEVAELVGDALQTDDLTAVIIKRSVGGPAGRPVVTDLEEA